jgi:diamine N-acetyltransferase
MKVAKVLATDAKALSELATRTFVATFGSSNTPTDMSKYLDESLSEPAVKRQLEDNKNTFLWAQDAEGTPVGYAKFRRGIPNICVTGPRPVELERLYVEPELIGTGVGNILLRNVMDKTHTEGFQTLWLGVWEHNPRAIQFYKRRGFVEVGAHTFQLGEDNQSDLIMQLTTVN